MNFIVLCFVIIVSGFIVQIIAQRSCATVNDQTVTRVTDLENADFIFAGLFPIKEMGCKTYELEKGVERMEAMIRALELINKNTSILTGNCRDTHSNDIINYDQSFIFHRHKDRIRHAGYMRPGNDWH